MINRLRLMIKMIKKTGSAIAAHRAITLVSLIVITGACLAGYAALRYPDDGRFLEETYGDNNNTGTVRQELIRDIISESGSLSVAPDYSREVREKISLLRTSGYLIPNPYARSPYVFRYATGKTELWVDEKSSVLLPCGSSMRFSLAPAEGSRIEFYAAAISFAAGQGKRTVDISITAGGKQEKISSQEVEIYDRRTFEKHQVPVSRSFPAIYPSTGWYKVSADISMYSGKKITVDISSPDREGIIFIGNPLHYAGAETKKYNVIHIVFDAMNRDYMGIYNPSSTLTPNFVARQKDFIVFDKFYSVATNTRIYLSGMFTSQFSPATRHGYNEPVISDEEKNLFYNDPKMDTIPQAMKRNGYLAIQVGNSGFTNPVLDTAVDYGFSESLDFQAMPYDSTGVAYHMMRKLREHKNVPLYLYAHFNTTHSPRITPLKYYFKGLFSMPDKIWRSNVTGSTVHADAIFLQLVNALKKEGYWDNTVVIISSDHGTLYNVRNFGRNYLFDDFIRTPFLVHLPDELRKKYAGGLARFKPATSVINLGPTILDITGSPASANFRGKSMLPYMGMKNPPLYTDEYIRSFDNYGASIIYRGRWKYVQYQYNAFQDREFRTRKFIFFGEGPEDSSEMLYDLDNDNSEKRNLLGSEKEITSLCRRAFFDGSANPALNLVTLFPDEKKHKVTVRAALKQPLIRAGIVEKNETDSVYTEKESCEFTVTVTDKPRYVYFEGVSSDTPFSVNVLSDGYSLDNEHFLCGSYNLPLVSLNRPVEGVQLMSALLVTGKPAVPRNVSGLSANLSRMDIRRWAKDQHGGAEAGMDPGMKEVLKSWGYIQ